MLKYTLRVTFPCRRSGQTSWPCCVNKNCETISPACLLVTCENLYLWKFSAIQYVLIVWVESEGQEGMHTSYGWRVRVRRVCTHRMGGEWGSGGYAHIVWVEGEGWEGMRTSYVYEWGAIWVQKGGCTFTCRPSLRDVYIHTRVCGWVKGKKKCEADSVCEGRGWYLHCMQVNEEEGCTCET